MSHNPQYLQMQRYLEKRSWQMLIKDHEMRSFWTNQVGSKSNYNILMRDGGVQTQGEEKKDL